MYIIFIYLMKDIEYSLFELGNQLIEKFDLDVVMNQSGYVLVKSYYKI